MFDLNSLVEISRVAGLIYLALVAGLVMMVLRARLGWSARFALTAAIIAIFLGLPGKVLYDEKLRKDAAAARAKEAWARYEARCKTAGVKIYREVDNVRGIFLANVRRDELNRGGQFEMTDPYGNDSRGDGYISSFLDERNSLGQDSGHKLIDRGFTFVDMVDQASSQRLRYSGRSVELWERDHRYARGNYEFQLSMEIAVPPYPKYGVIFQDISTREDREFWIAGSSLRVYDVETQEVLAERIGHMIDPGQGATGGGRAPWLIAAHYACPWFYQPGTRWDQGNPQYGQTRRFVVRVLHPAQ